MKSHFYLPDTLFICINRAETTNGNLKVKNLVPWIRIPHGLFIPIDLRMNNCVDYIMTTLKRTADLDQPVLTPEA